MANAKADVKTVKQNERSGIKRKIDDAREKAQEVGGKIHDAYGTSKEKIEATALKAKDRATSLYGDCKGYVDENPGKSTLFAAGAGLLIGFVIGAAILRRRN